MMLAEAADHCFDAVDGRHVFTPTEDFIVRNAFGGLHASMIAIERCAICGSERFTDADPLARERVEADLGRPA